MMGGAEEVVGAAIESVTSEPEPPQPFRTKMETKVENTIFQSNKYRVNARS
jgi:hypothetical protein